MDGDEDNDMASKDMEIEYRLCMNGLFFTEMNTWTVFSVLARKMTYGDADSFRMRCFPDATIEPIKKA
ncbi:MAG: hypothetical protein Q8Q90_00455 [bacterium]|nr:hypothetical protein [bacterium]